MTLYTSGLYQNMYEPSYPNKHGISTLDDFKQVVCNTDYSFALYRDGYTQSGKFVKNHRCREDWIKSDALYADFDDGFTIKDFAALFSKYEYYLTTSKSHQILKEGAIRDRFHAVFPIKEIEDIERHKAYLKILHEKLLNKLADKACVDSARFFFANNKTEVFYNPGKSIDFIIEKIYDKMPKEVIKPEPVISSGYNRMIISRLDKAYKYGWFKDYSNWLNLGMALHKAGFDVTVWQKYCDTDKDVKIADYKWRGFKEGTLGLNYLLDICKKIRG